MSRVVTLASEEFASLSDKIQRHLGLHSGEALVLIEGDDFVLVKRASSVSLSERFKKLSSETRERFKKLDLGPDEVERAVRWARESS